MMMIASDASARSSCTSTISAAATISLSATGSRNAPNAEVWPQLAREIAVGPVGDRGQREHRHRQPVLRRQRQPRRRQVVDADEHRDQDDPQPGERGGKIERHCSEIIARWARAGRHSTPMVWGVASYRIVFSLSLRAVKESRGCASTHKQIRFAMLLKRHFQWSSAKMRSASARLMPGTRARSSTLAACTPLSPPKCASSALRRVAPMPPIDPAATTWFAPCPGARDDPGSRSDAPRRGSAAAGAAPGGPTASAVARSRSGNTISSSPGLRSGPLAMPISLRRVQALLGEHLGRDADLSLAAVDDQQVGRRIFAGDDARDAARQRLAHRRVVVAADVGLDVEAAVLAGLHRQAGRRSRSSPPPPRPSCGSRRSIRCAAPSAASPSASCSAASRSSCVAFCASFCPIASSAFCTAIVTHTRRSPPGFGTSATLCPDCEDSTSASTGSSPPCSAMMVGGARPIEVVLHQERGHDLVQRRAFGVLREERAVADVPAAADHHHVHRGEPLRGHRRRRRRCRRRSRSRRTAATAAAVRRVILSRRRAARSNASIAAASSICRCSPASTSLVLPCRNSVALLTSS